MAKPISKLLSLRRQSWLFVKDEKLREMLERDYMELRNLIQADANKSVLLMCGSILEASLISVLQENNPSIDYTARQWGLSKLIETAERAGLLDATEIQYASFLNDYRDLIHPGREHREKIDLDNDTVVAVVSLFKRVLRSLIGESPPPRDLFIAELRRRRGNEEEVRFAEKVFEWAEKKSVRLGWSKGKSITCNLKIDHNDCVYGLVKLSTAGNIQFKFGNLKLKQPFNHKTRLTELRVRFNSISSRINLSERDMGRFPTILMSVVLSEQGTQKFLDTLEWLVNRIRL